VVSSSQDHTAASLLISKKRASLTSSPDIKKHQATTKKVKPRKLISPLTLLNDHSIVGKDRDVFKGLKGDKQILRHYYNIDRIIADIQSTHIA
jgi:hypothetical protein